jgi:hypothetical protein
MEGDNKVKIKKEPIELEDLFFTDTEGREHFYKPYHVENENFVKKEFDTDIKEFDTEISIKSEPGENDINCKMFIKTETDEMNIKIELDELNEHNELNGMNIKSENNFDGEDPLDISSVHEGKKPRRCKICNEEFSLIKHFNEHMAKVHEVKKPYKCDVCKALFKVAVHFNPGIFSPKLQP